jgi:lipid-A-disaccharide synthase
MKTILMTCGETSGDHHAASLISSIRKIDPDTRIIAMGGEAMASAGADVRFSMEDYAFMGFSEIVSGLPRIIKLERRLGDILSGGDIDLYIPVDYPGLNLRIASRAKKADIPVLYFISPQVWAWAGWRTRKMRKVIDLMAVILPFEVDFYRKRGIPVFFAGHPMVNEITPPTGPKRAPRKGEPIVVLLFPGSRRQEVLRHLGPMLGAARIIKRKRPECIFRLGAAPLIDDDLLTVPDDMKEYLSITRTGISDLSEAALVIASSGTITLQTALSGTPMVVIYRTSKLTYLLARSMVTTQYIAMPNVLAEKAVVPELIQGDAQPQQIAKRADDLLDSGARYENISSMLLSLRDSLRFDDGIDLLASRALSMAGDRGRTGQN